MALNLSSQKFSLSELVETACKHKRYMTPAQIELIQREFGAMKETKDGGFGVEFDLMEEVGHQIAAAQMLRKANFAPDGSIVTTSKEAKEALSASLSLLKMLVDMQGELFSQARMRAIEVAVTETMKDLGEEVQGRFISTLTERLERAV